MKQRILTAVIAAAVFLPIVIIGGIPFIVLVYALASVGLYELLKMRKLSIFSVPGVLSLLLVWVILLPDRYIHVLHDLEYSKIQLASLAVLLFLSFTVAVKNRFTFDDVGFVILTSLYVGLGFYYFIETREESLLFVFYSLFIIWATDSGAYFIGRAAGKRKLWPEISPNKTVEGFLGGIGSAVAVAILFILFSNIETPAFTLLVATAFLSVFGQLGDLAESAFKRHYQVKDSGNILPGHGGILDRFDSLLFVWPLLHIFQLL